MNRNPVEVYTVQNPQEDSEALLRKATARYIGADWVDWVIDKNRYGKPCFKGHLETCFSVSHSGEYWACAFYDHNLGFDIQQHVPCGVERITRRFFHSNEQQLLRNQGFAPDLFFDLWTAKESYIKYTGKGLAEGLDTFDASNPIPGVCIQHFSFANEYSACICTDNVAIIHVQELVV